MRRLRYFRTAFCLALAAGLAVNLSKFQEQVSHFRLLLGERPLPLLPAVSWLGFLAPPLLSWHAALGLLVVAALLAAAVLERHARVALAAALILLLLYAGLLLSCDWHFPRYHTAGRIFDLLFPVLLLLLIEPGSSRSPDTRLSRLVLLGAQLSLALIYFGSGIAKLGQGAGWIDGEVLRGYLLLSHAHSGAHLPLALAQSLSLCSALSILALLFELTAPALVFFRRGRLFFFFAAAGFHLFAELVLGVSFLIPFFAAGFLAFVPESWFSEIRNRACNLKGIAAVLVLFPAAARADPASYRAPHFGCVVSDERLLYRLRAGCEGKADNPDGSSVAYRLNQLGLWDEEHAPAAAAGAVRVLFLGNSLWIPHRAGGDVPGAFREAAGNAPVETVNGSMNGFSLVQSYLFLDELLARYHPRVVLVLGNVQGNGLSTYYHHEIAASRDAKGLATSIGPAKSFWPLPEWLAPRLWASPSAFRWLIWCTAARELWLLSSRVLSNGEKPAEVYERYLTAIVAKVRAAGAEPVLVREDGLDPGVRVVSYKAETIAAKIWPRAIIGREEANDTYQRLSSSGLRVLDLHSLPGAPHGGEFDIPGDIHLTLEGMRAEGNALGEALRPLLISLAPEPGRGKRRSR